MNPVLALEIATRWRKIYSFAALFVSVLAIAALAFLVMRISQSLEEVIAAQIGRVLFGNYALGAWFLILIVVPAHAAPAIASERQNGTLAGLVLTHLTPQELLSGKLASCLLFPLIVMVSTLPLVTLAMGYGGVGLADFAYVWVIHAFTAYACAAVGLFFSVRHGSANSALSATYGSLFIWFFLTSLAFARSETTSGPFHAFTQSVAGTNPLFGLYNIAFVDAHVSLLTPNIWQPCVFGLVTGTGFLWAARRATHGHFETVDARRSFHAQSKAAWGQPAGLRRIAGRVSNNAVFQADLARHLKWLERRRGPLTCEIWLLLGLIFMLGIILLNPTSAWNGLVAIFIRTALPLVVLETARAAVFSVWRDKNSGVWEQVILTSMKPGEIVLGRLTALLVRFCVTFGPLASLIFALKYQNSATTYALADFGATHLFRFLCDGVLAACAGYYFGLRAASPGAAFTSSIVAMFIYWGFRGIFVSAAAGDFSMVAGMVSLGMSAALLALLMVKVRRYPA